MIPLQLDVSPSLFDTGKALPNSETSMGALSEGVLPADPIDFAVLIDGLSENQDTGVKTNQVLIEASLDVVGEEPVIDAEVGVNLQSPLHQLSETPVSPDSSTGNAGIDPDNGVPPSGVMPGDVPLYDMAEPADSNEIGTGDLLAEWVPEAPRSLPTDEAHEVTPMPHVSKEVPTDGPYRLNQTVPAGVSDNIPDFKVVETAGKDVFPGLMASPMPEGSTLVTGAVEGAQGSGFPSKGPNNITPMLERQVLLAGKDIEASQKVAMVNPFAENGERPQAGPGGRASLVPSEAFENLSIRGLIAGGRQEVSGSFAEGRDNGQSSSSDGGKAGMLNLQLMQTAAGQDPHNISGKPETVLPGVLQKSGSENPNQIEKMTGPLTGSPLTTVSEKGDIVEALRLPLEPREIRTFTDIIEKAVWGRENGQNQARIQLKPSFLGHLHLNVIMDQLKVTVEIRAETLLVRDFLETNLQVLKTDLQASGLEIDKIDVLVDPDLNNQQDQGRASAHKQANRMNEHSKEMETLEDKEPARPEDVIPSGREENQIDCFV